MSKITRTETILHCDFCHAEAKSTVPLGWFRVQSVYAEMRMAAQCNTDPCEAPNWHACNECGGKLYRWLKRLGIDYTFVPARGTHFDPQAEGGPQFGNILVGVKGKA